MEFVHLVGVEEATRAAASMRASVDHMRALVAEQAVENERQRQFLDEWLLRLQGQSTERAGER